MGYSTKAELFVFRGSKRFGILYIKKRKKGSFQTFNLDNVPMKAVQLRMARAAVGWGVRELAERAGITANTVTRIENGADAKQSTMDRLQGALEAAGVEFTNGDQPGVRLTRAAAARSAEAAAASKRRLPRKQSAAKLPMRPRKNDRILASLVALGRGAENWLRLAKMPAGANGPLTDWGGEEGPVGRI